jgi:hypothetical protein
MPAKFKVGSHVCWNSEAGRVSGKIVEVHRPVEPRPERRRAA